MSECSCTYEFLRVLFELASEFLMKRVEFIYVESSSNVLKSHDFFNILCPQSI